jgi:hypothetical protein
MHSQLDITLIITPPTARASAGESVTRHLLKSNGGFRFVPTCPTSCITAPHAVRVGSDKIVDRAHCRRIACSCFRPTTDVGCNRIDLMLHIVALNSTKAKARAR